MKKLIELDTPYADDVNYSYVDKNRIVFAGSLPKARCDQSYMQQVMDLFKTLQLADDRTKALFSMGDQITISIGVKNIIDNVSDQWGISGDDKESFDMFIHLFFTLLYPAMYITPYFAKSEGASEYWRASVVTDFICYFIGFEGLFKFTYITASGSLLTWSKGSETSRVSSDFTESLITGTDPREKQHTLSLKGVTAGQSGDDYFGNADKRILEESSEVAAESDDEEEVYSGAN